VILHGSSSGGGGGSGAMFAGSDAYFFHICLWKASDKCLHKLVKVALLIFGKLEPRFGQRMPADASE
jgi:hypothetical protein